MKTKFLYGLLAVLCLLIITNPSISGFKSFRGSDTYDGLYRTTNFFIFSEYKQGSNKYIGLFGNFFRVPKPSSYYYSHSDSVKNGLSSDSLVLTIPDFSKRVKAKYPEYINNNDTDVVQEILIEYPVYSNKVDMSRISNFRIKSQKLYAELKSNSTITELPSTYIEFIRLLSSQKEAFDFYNTLKENKNIIGLPDKFSEFINKLDIHYQNKAIYHP